jgi:hypothetical protein
MGAMQKGSAFERKISKKLSLWWSENNRDDLVYRTSQSGGRATQRKKGGKTTANSYGDLAPQDAFIQPLFDLFTFELKKGYSNDLDIISIVDSNKKRKLDDFIIQTKTAQENAKTPFIMLIMERDRRDEVVLIEDCLYRRREISTFLNDLNSIKINIELGVFYLFKLDDFLKRITPKIIIELAGKV